MAFLTACDREYDVPLVRYEVRMEADARSPAACEGRIGISFEPVQVDPQVAGNLYQMNAFSNLADLAGTPVLDGPDNWECWYAYQSPALAPGKWLIAGEFPNGSKSCLKDVGPGMPNRVRIDQEEGCVEF